MGAVEVSICAVTFRRPEGLARLIESLARLKLPEGLVAEVVLVDNDPEASAYGAPGRVEQAGTLPVRWLHAGATNISLGRNRAVDAAAGRWIAWIDDDETAHEGWIAAYHWLSEQVEADGFFGPVQPRLEAPGQAWIDLPTFYGRARFSTGTLLRRRGLFTSNAYVRRALLRELRFDPAFGATGGEDSDCFLRARRQGARLLWCDEARVDEWIPPERHRAGFLARRAFEQGATWVRIQRVHEPAAAWRSFAGALARIAGALLALPLAALRGRRRLLLAWMRVASQLGRLHGLLGGRPDRRP